jgi:hypothetical protein
MVELLKAHYHDTELVAEKTGRTNKAVVTMKYALEDMMVIQELEHVSKVQPINGQYHIPFRKFTDTEIQFMADNPNIPIYPDLVRKFGVRRNTIQNARNAHCIPRPLKPGLPTKPKPNGKVKISIVPGKEEPDEITLLIDIKNQLSELIDIQIRLCRGIEEGNAMRQKSIEQWNKKYGNNPVTSNIIIGTGESPVVSS